MKRSVMVLVLGVLAGSAAGAQAAAAPALRADTVVGAMQVIARVQAGLQRTIDSRLEALIGPRPLEEGRRFGIDQPDTTHADRMLAAVHPATRS